WSRPTGTSRATSAPMASGRTWCRRGRCAPWRRSRSPVSRRSRTRGCSEHRSAGTSPTSSRPPGHASPSSRTGSRRPPARSSTSTGASTPSAPNDCKGPLLTPNAAKGALPNTFQQRGRVQAAVATGWTEGCPSMPGARLTSEERAKIEVLFGEGYTFPQIAKAIGRDRTTVWREVRRNNSHNGLVGVGARHPLRRCAANPTGLGGAYRWAYCARDAQRRAQARARRPREGKLRPRRGGPWPPLWAEVKAKLMLRWSPVQIARWLRRSYPDQPERWVSHETIYQAIFYQARGGMRQELARQVALRSGRTARKPQSRLAQAERSRRPWVREFHISTR